MLNMKRIEEEKGANIPFRMGRRNGELRKAEIETKREEKGGGSGVPRLKDGEE